LRDGRRCGAATARARADEDHVAPSVLDLAAFRHLGAGDMSSRDNTAVTRRLAAIPIADVVGYTRLMERDDTGTFARLRNIRDEVVDPAIVPHGGRVVKTAGDGWLAEFPSALAALRASVQIQGE